MVNFQTHIDNMDPQVLSHLDSGEVVVYRPGVGSDVTISTIQDNGFEFIPAGEPGTIGTSPAIFCLLADLNSDPVTDEAARVLVDGVEFSIPQPQADGKGGVLMMLHRSVDVTNIQTESGLGIQTEAGQFLVTE